MSTEKTNSTCEYPVWREAALAFIASRTGSRRLPMDGPRRLLAAFEAGESAQSMALALVQESNARRDARRAREAKRQPQRRLMTTDPELAAMQNAIRRALSGLPSW